MDAMCLNLLSAKDTIEAALGTTLFLVRKQESFCNSLNVNFLQFRTLFNILRHGSLKTCVKNQISHLKCIYESH